MDNIIGFYSQLSVFFPNKEGVDPTKTGKSKERSS